MTFANNPDRDWEIWGKKQPYFGVISDPKFLDENLNDEALQEFFDTGARHVEHVYSVIRASVQPDFQPVRVLDYGCGVGRVAIPLAHRSQMVVGVDVSPSMLKRARENCDRFDATSAQLLNVDELDSLPPASFELVHSFIVFQHIPPARGELILRKLISLIAEGGVGAIHFTYADKSHAFRRGVSALFRRVNLSHRLGNLVRGRPFSAPLMQMNSYSTDRIFDILLDEHCSNLHVEFSVHNANRGVMLYFEKLPKALL